MPDANHLPVGSFRYQLIFSEASLKPGGGIADKQVAGGAFSECSGLEATMEPRTIREGGFNYGVHQRAGTVTFATVILRRGMTLNRDLWDWFKDATLLGGYTHRMNVSIRHLDIDGETVVRTWKLERALPVKFKSADLNAKSGEVAIEELHLVHEGLKLA